MMLDSRTLQIQLAPHAPRLLEYLGRHIPPNVRRVIDPQDVAQDAFFDAVRAADASTFENPESVWRWLVTIARHRLLKVLKAHQTLKRGGGRLGCLGDEEVRHGSVILVLQDLAVYDRTPSRSAASHEFYRILDASIERLEPAYRTAVRLRYVDGLSLEETAGRLSRTEDSTQKLCARGLAALRDQLRNTSRFF